MFGNDSRTEKITCREDNRKNKSGRRITEMIIGQIIQYMTFYYLHKIEKKWRIEMMNDLWEE